MAKCGPIAIDHRNKLFWFDDQPQQMIPLINRLKKFKHIPVALINDITVPPRSACCAPVQCNCPVTLTNSDAQFDGNENIQAKKRITLPNVTDTVKENVTQIVIVNWSNQPETLYAKTVMGTVGKLYDNGDIAVIVDNSNTGTEENASVSYVEAQFNDIAQGTPADDTSLNTSWYDSIEWDEMNLTAGQKTALLPLILQFAVIFAMIPTDL